MEHPEVLAGDVHRFACGLLARTQDLRHPL